MTGAGAAATCFTGADAGAACFTGAGAGTACFTGAGSDEAGSLEDRTRDSTTALETPETANLWPAEDPTGRLAESWLFIRATPASLTGEAKNTCRK